MENKFYDGEEVYAKVKPTQKLIIRCFKNRIYYCKIKKDLTLKEVVYFERELMSASTME
jgi:hypothetical protein